MTPVLTIALELEGPVLVMPVCETLEEEERLAFDLLARELRLDERVHLWAETTLAHRESHERSGS